MLDFIGTVITVALMVLVITTLITFMDASRGAKITLVAVMGIWIGLAAAASGAGWLTISRPIPVVGLFLLVPLLAAAFAAAWPAARTAMLSIPMQAMVALNVVRVFAVLFLMLAAEGRLTGPFPYSAAWGDIITGVVAVPVLWLLKDGATRYTTAIAAWNLFGVADLVLAIAFGVTSAEGSPLQLFRGPLGLPQAIEAAARNQLTSPAEYVRRALVRALAADGVHLGADGAIRLVGVGRVEPAPAEAQ
jgi:hypothetical protein